MKGKHRQIAIAAAATIVCAAAGAQDNQTRQRQQQNVWADSLAYDEYLAGQALRASELIGASVQNEQGESLGEVTDLIVSRQDDVMQAVIAVGGVLGVGEKQIAVPYERLRVSADGETLFLSMTSEQLEAAPELEEPQRGEARVSRSPAQPSSERPAAQPQPQAAQRQQAAEAQAGQAERQAQQAERQAEQVEQQAQQRQEQQREQAEQQAQQRQEQQREQAEQQAQQRQEQQARQSAQRQAAAPEQPEPSEQVIVMERSDRRATELIGMTVVDSRGEQVGEIDDLVVSPEDGRILAVVAVGGVLGVGERLVSLPLDEVQITQPATRAAPGAEQQGGDRQQSTVRLNMTSDDLRTRPEFQYSDAERTANLR